MSEKWLRAFGLTRDPFTKEIHTDCWLYGSECCEDREAKVPS
jgi:hypothetical protein